VRLRDPAENRLDAVGLGWKPSSHMPRFSRYVLQRSTSNLAVEYQLNNPLDQQRS
jgi:hypothetical protein